MRLFAILSLPLLLLTLSLSGCGGSAPAATVAVAAPPPGMVRIPGGTFRMGTDSGYPYEGPAHDVTVRPFYMDAREVTNAEFARFVEATGYRTVAERWGWS